MPNKRRPMSCQTCRRLKTRCEASPGSQRCNRCTTLRLDCSLPFAPNESSSTPSLRSQVEAGSSHNNSQNDQRVICECGDRLDAIETSLSEIKQLLLNSQNVTSQMLNGGCLPDSTSNNIQADSSDAGSYEQDIEPEEEASVMDRFSDSKVLEETGQDVQAAPIKVVRHLHTLINGSPSRDHSENIIDELSKMDLASGGLVNVLLEGFKQISHLRPFIIHDSPEELLKQNHHLLFATCLLAGIQTVGLCHGSALHRSLYGCVKSHLGIEMLNTPVPLSTIQALLIFSTWNLCPSLTTRYIDSWFLSGSAVSHSMVTLDLSKLAAKSHFRDKGARDKYRTWMLILLVHLKFAVGTGQPSVIDIESLKRWTVSVNPLPKNCEPCDKATAAELELYILLYEVVHKNEKPISTAWSQVENWAERYLNEGKETFLGNYLSLCFAYSSVSLILARWELAKAQKRSNNLSHQHHHRRNRSQEEVANNDQNDSSTTHVRFSSQINLILRHSHLLLDQVMDLCSQTALVNPSYDFLLTAYAGVTLVEYATFITNPQYTYELMEKVQFQQARCRGSKYLESVFNWATNVMRKRVYDFVQQQQAKVNEVKESNLSDTQYIEDQDLWTVPTDWVPNVLVCSNYDLDQDEFMNVI
ncbi:hypothetical protein BGW36DRAFT_376755 [Talaromyces proteolyticus]|uniref:Transcriptional activator of proteases prtT n=1 Tax=Talaromyces proteolyticus TaxID=1131652 RepID=A0AAD4KRH6_9EURO|nr:uncharacterized protein BGW36DRAFT_376755 [Talaromyces proteolyticus]KAH8698809.1 hypothetical protein BGW36DRAFT_376755 [Talaromyces proteolyticus]